MVIRPHKLSTTITPTIALICYRKIEANAVVHSFDETYDIEPEAGNDKVCYSFGRIGKHIVVLAQPPTYGPPASQTMAKSLTSQFPEIRVRLSIGIAFGAPSSTRVLPGDVVVSNYSSNIGVDCRNPELKTFVGWPCAAIGSAVTVVGAKYIRGKETSLGSLRRGTDLEPDVQALGEAQRNSNAISVNSADASQSLNMRDNNSTRRRSLRMRGGRILAESGLMSEVKNRDKLAKEEGYLCFDTREAVSAAMEGFALIRGVYCSIQGQDDEEAEELAARAAAAYARDLLMVVNKQHPGIRLTLTGKHVVHKHLLEHQNVARSIR